MTCAKLHPEGHRRVWCLLEAENIRLLVSGGEAENIRLLKAWAKLATDYETKDDHFNAFCRVLKDADTG